MAFVQAMTKNPCKKGVNGADVYTEAGVGDERVTLFTMLNRGLEETYIQEAVKSIAASNREDEIRDLFVMAFQTRDIRGGKGEKKLFYQFFEALYHFWPYAAVEMLSLVPEYGCWRDMWELWGRIPELKRAILGVVKEQFMKDLSAAARGELNEMSLLAKWLPREKSATYRGFASRIAGALYPNETSERRQLIRYRKETSFMNSELKTVEVDMCGGRWRKINPEAVPGRNLKLHDKAFLNETKTGDLRRPDDSDRMKCRKHFQEFVKDLASGKKTAHGANVVLPHELVLKAQDPTTMPDQHVINQAQWESIRDDTLKLGGLGKAVAMCDFSGSMAGIPLQISLALGILISECTHPSFKDYILTFDATPQWHSFKQWKTLKGKLDSLRGCGQGLNTDFYKACQMILTRMIQWKVTPEDAPEDLIVITDMGFDTAANTDNYSSSSRLSSWETQLSRIQREFREAGEYLWGKGNGWMAPRIVIWNVRAAFKDFHATADQEGVVQLSGWSPSILKALQKGGVQVQTPYQGMRAILDDARYDPIRARYAGWDA
jgi:hypothetical protein